MKSASHVEYRPSMAEEKDGEPPTRSRLEPAAWATLGLLTVTWAWWAAKEGAYFSSVLLPGLMLLCIGAALLLGWARWRADLRRSPAVPLALGAFTALGVWAALSALWSPAPDIAIGDGHRILGYALCFGLGVGLCNLLGPRIHLALVPLTAAGAFAGLLTVANLAFGDVPRELLEHDGTLDFPIGYRNAEAAFFAIAVFPALGLAAARELDWRLRGAALATATLCLQLVLLAQSRGSVLAIAVAVAIYLLLAPLRVRALCWLVLAVLTSLAILPALTSLYVEAKSSLMGSVDEMHTAGLVAGAVTAATLVLGALAARYERRLPGLGSDTARSNPWVAVGLATLVVAGVGGFLVAVDDPADWISNRVDEFRTPGSPDLSGRSSRFTFDISTDRYDAWRVAIDGALEDPLLGEGGGGYQYRYQRERETSRQNLHDAHSVELEILSEYGFVGLALFAIAIAAALAGVLRARRRGPAEATLAAIALATAGYWFVHTSVDWFWPYPALTAPVLALLGSAAAPAIATADRRAPTRWRFAAIAALALLAISAIPPFLAQRYVDNAYATWRTDPDRAFEDLDRARRLSPFNDAPLLAEGAIANAIGDRDRALAAFREAAEVRPEEFATHYLLAELLAETDRAAAREEIRLALEQNPLQPLVRVLARELGVKPPPRDELS
jgi:tetratricopeptide (TPR) repeat protein